MSGPSRLDYLAARYVFAPCTVWARGIAIYAFLVALLMALLGHLSASFAALAGGAVLIGFYLWAARRFWRRWSDQREDAF